jgi:hypothetical protein
VIVVSRLRMRRRLEREAPGRILSRATEPAMAEIR